jgi:hypothetical protein
VVTLVNTLVVMNLATNAGGVHVDGRSRATLANCTVAGNRALREGGGIFAVGPLTAWNTVVWANRADGGTWRSVCSAGGSVDIRHSCVEGGWPGSGVITANPMLGPDYRLGAGSPCIDAGSDLGAPDDDRVRMRRPLDGRGLGAAAYDMGALEFIAAAADSDGDGMADAWELSQGFDPALATDARGDPDADGLDNLGECLAGSDPFRADTDGDGVGDLHESVCGTDPRNAARYFTVDVEGAVGGGSPSLTWPGVAGRLYTVLWAPSVTGPWYRVPWYIDLPGAGSVLSCSNLVVSGRDFYRVLVRRVGP